MLIDVRAGVGPYRHVLVMRDDTHEVVKLCFTADTDAGWFDCYVKDPLRGGVLVENGYPKTERTTDVPFHVVWKDSLRPYSPDTIEGGEHGKL